MCSDNLDLSNFKVNLCACIDELCSDHPVWYLYSKSVNYRFYPSGIKNEQKVSKSSVSTHNWRRTYSRNANFLFPPVSRGDPIYCSRTGGTILWWPPPVADTRPLKAFLQSGHQLMRSCQNKLCSWQKGSTSTPAQARWTRTHEHTSHLQDLKFAPIL